MTGIIRYAHGDSSLGTFVAALSDRGLVMLEFGDLEHFPAKWTPVCVAKMRPNKEIEPSSDSIGTEQALTGARLDELRSRFPEADILHDPAFMQTTFARLTELIEHPAAPFDLPLDMRGTEFELRVWNALRDIPAGRTVSYGEIAARIGAPREAREVAEACAANTLAVIVPCHRVVKKDGSISGYRWGFKRKRALLEREHRAVFQLA